jgi:hypothetical protein
VGTAEIFTDREVLAIHSDPDELRLGLPNVTLGNPLPNARFYRRSLLQRVGEFDLRYRMGSDRDWLLRMLRLRPTEIVMASPVYRYRRHGGSLTINDHSGLAEPLWRECIEIAEAWLARDDLSTEEREVLRAWHRQQSIQASLHFIRHGPWSRAREFIKRGGEGGSGGESGCRDLEEAAVGFVRPRKMIAP